MNGLGSGVYYLCFDVAKLVIEILILLRREDTHGLLT